MIDFKEIQGFEEWVENNCEIPYPYTKSIYWFQDLLYYLKLCLVQKFLREDHEIHLYVDPADNESYGIIVGEISEQEWIYEGGLPKYFKTYEQALEAGIKENRAYLK